MNGAVVSLGVGSAVGVGARHMFGGRKEMLENSDAKNFGMAAITAGVTGVVGTVMAVSDADKVKRGLQLAGRSSEAARITGAGAVKNLLTMKMGVVPSSTFGMVGMGIGAAGAYAAYALLND